MPPRINPPLALVVPVPDIVPPDQVVWPDDVERAGAVKRSAGGDRVFRGRRRLGPLSLNVPAMTDVNPATRVGAAHIGGGEADDTAAGSR